MDRIGFARIDKIGMADGYKKVLLYVQDQTQEHFLYKICEVAIPF